MKIERFNFILTLLQLLKLPITRASNTYVRVSNTGSVREQDTSISSRRLEECFLYNKDFRTAKSDPDAQPNTNSRNETYYSYKQCYDTNSSSLDILSANFKGNCFPEQHQFGSDSDGFDCYADTMQLRLGCCLGNNMSVLFKYYSYDLSISISTARCGSSYTYTTAYVFPSYQACSDWYGEFAGERDAAACGSCSDPVPGSNAHHIPALSNAVGLSFILLMATFLL